MSSELIPGEVVLLLYRRYLKSAIRVPNQVIRSLLLQQIRSGFRQHMHMRSALAQRECIAQAQKDLVILEDERHARTLYINRFGAVSCIEWEMRRTEWHVTPTGQRAWFVFSAVILSCFAYIIFSAQRVEEYAPDITQTVDLMAMKLEVDNPKQLWEKREADIKRQLETAQRVRSLEERILSTFKDVPAGMVPDMPTLQNPNGSLRNIPVQQQAAK
jgi:hypothetical protein